MDIKYNHVCQDYNMGRSVTHDNIIKNAKRE